MYMENGLFQFTYSNNCMVEFLHVDNFVQAHIKAAKALQLEHSPVVSVYDAYRCKGIWERSLENQIWCPAGPLNVVLHVILKTRLLFGKKISSFRFDVQLDLLM